jgi:hypothetical protein
MWKKYKTVVVISEFRPSLEKTGPFDTPVQTPGLTVACPTCGAATGEQCELNTGIPRTHPHNERELEAINLMAGEKPEVAPLPLTGKGTKRRSSHLRATKNATRFIKLKPILFRF